MRVFVRFLLLFIPALALVLIGFLRAMEHLEKDWVRNDLEQRAGLVASTADIPLKDLLRQRNSKKLQEILNRMKREPRLLGAALCDTEGQLIAKSEGLKQSRVCGSTSQSVERVVSSETQKNGIIPHRFTHTLIHNQNVLGTLHIFQNPAILEARGQAAQRYIIMAFIALGIVVSLLTLVVYKWSVQGPITQLMKTLKFIAAGRSKFVRAFDDTDLGPLVRNLEQVLQDLRQKNKAPEAELGALWTAARLRSETKRLYGDSKFCVIANREPYIHNRKGKNIEVQFPSSGLVSAVEPILRACSGLWIGHGSGSADRETADRNGIILVPPGKPEYALKRVWLTKEEEAGYYYGFANEGLWPLCHIAHTRPTFRKEDWEYYQRVNQKFADAFNQEMKQPRPVALIQDYHFALLPGILRQMRPDVISSLFWHIPWPNPESIGICPWKNDIMRGMLGANLIGFHTQFHCNNFLDSVDRYLEARVDRENFSVTIRGHTCFVKPFPISIEWPPRNDAAPGEMPEIRARLLEEIGLPQNALVGVGVDRLDYTKGIIERFLAVERLLEKHPEFVGRFVFIQIGAPSRTQIKRYQDFNSEVQEVTNRINWRFGQGDYQPIILRMNHHDAAEVFRFYRASQVCYVSSLHDGMNLVAKEFVASRSDEKGVLVLSSFTGASKELKDALIVNPYDIEENADALYRALVMPNDEQRERMRRMREIVSINNVYNWAAQFLNQVHRIAELKKIREVQRVV